MPFEAPEGWEWTTIKELLINRDSERIPVSSAIRKKQINKVYDYYGASGVIDKVEGYLFEERLLLIGEDGANLLSRSKNNAFIADGKYWVNNHAHVLDCFDKSILDYVLFIINSMALDDYITGSAQPKLSQDNLNKILIPLPPLAEQHRIVSEIERLFNLIDEIENNKLSLEQFIKQTKQKVLDLAIRGKLVSQDPNDKTATELFAKNPTDIFLYPFEVPEGWIWAKLGDIGDWRSGATPSRKNKAYYNGDIPWLKTGDLTDGYISHIPENITEKALKETSVKLNPLNNTSSIIS